MDATYPQAVRRWWYWWVAAAVAALLVLGIPVGIVTVMWLLGADAFSALRLIFLVSAFLVLLWVPWVGWVCPYLAANDPPQRWYRDPHDTLGSLRILVWLPAAFMLLVAGMPWIWAMYAQGTPRIWRFRPSLAFSIASIAVALALALVGAQVWRVVRQRIRASMRRDQVCVQCGYQVRGVAGDTCPECGHPIATT